ncbi:MAG: cupin domain-containing protein [Chloroflexota bacterium]
MTQGIAGRATRPRRQRGDTTYDSWMESRGIPIHRGYFVEDLRTVELGWWAERECNAAFIQLEGMPGMCEGRVTEIPPGAALPPLKLGFDDLVYVLQGQGATTVWSEGSSTPRSFEWHPHSLFLIPRHHRHQIMNGRGDSTVRLLHYNYAPLAMAGSNSPDFFFNNPYEESNGPTDDLYAEAKAVKVHQDEENDPYLWYGNFFPDLAKWDRLSVYQRRGAGGHHVTIQLPDSEMSGHMSVFPVGTYKKGHRHGPGVGIVIPAGEGYSIMWPEGSEKVIVPWHEASMFVPPNRWFHQHFNLGEIPARYLALHPTLRKQLFGQMERVEDRARDQIEYSDEDPMIRERFESELAKRGQKSLMPAEIYENREYKWEFKEQYAKPTA